MDAVIPEKIIYCVSTIELIQNHSLEYIFTDGHATNALTKFYDERDIESIRKIVDYDAISAKYWKNEEDLDIKRRKEAEFLVASDIPYSGILGFGVYNDISKGELLGFGVPDSKIKIKRGYYF